MESFYRSMRKRYDILMEKDKPYGGQWNYDQKNRQAYDGHVPIPKPQFFANDVTPICQTLQKWNERHGDMACPFNSLYWDFFARHRKRLGKNARVGMMYRVWDRMDSGEKKQVLNQATAYLKNLNRL